MTGEVIGDGDHLDHPIGKLNDLEEGVEAFRQYVQALERVRYNIEGHDEKNYPRITGKPPNPVMYTAEPKAEPFIESEGSYEE